MLPIPKNWATYVDYLLLDTIGSRGPLHAQRTVDS